MQLLTNNFSKHWKAVRTHQVFVAFLPPPHRAFKRANEYFLQRPSLFHPSDKTNADATQKDGAGGWNDRAGMA